MIKDFWTVRTMYSSPSDSTVFWVTFTSLVLLHFSWKYGTGIEALYGFLQIYKICYPNVLIRLIGLKPENEKKKKKTKAETSTIRSRVLLPHACKRWLPESLGKFPFWKFLKTLNLQRIKSFLIAWGTSHFLFLGVPLLVAFLIFLSSTYMSKVAR